MVLCEGIDGNDEYSSVSAPTTAEVMPSTNALMEVFFAYFLK